MTAVAAASVWKTRVLDSFGMVLAIWAIPAAILLIGAPIVLVVALVIKLAGWLLQR
jgi:hypothetical protein